MQKLFILLSLIAITSFNCNSVSAQDNGQIPLHPIATQGQSNSSETGTVQGGLQRSPVYIPSVFLSNHTLLFEECCIGCEIEIMENDEVVYSTIITDANGTVQLPEDLSGNFELCLYWSSFAFVGEFELLPY